jgi:hypothetical protein
MSAGTILKATWGKQMSALIHVIHYIKQDTPIGFTFYSDMAKSPFYHILQENTITPSRNMFTLCDSSWDDDHGTSRSTGGYLISCQGGVVDHSSTIPELLTMRSAKAEYNESLMV